MTEIVCAALLLVAAWQWARKRLHREPAAETADEPFVFDTRDPEDDPTEWNRSEREVHGMTASELADVNERFEAIVAGLDVVTLESLTEADLTVLSMMAGSIWGDEAELILPSGIALKGADVRRLIAEMRSQT